jgi:hypothetical protein
LATSHDVPNLSVVYKLVEVEYNGHVEPKTKFSEQKVYAPGPKQVFRFTSQGLYAHDLIATAGENYPEATALLQPAMRHGRRVDARPTTSEIRAKALANLERLPNRYKILRGAPPYPVRKSAALERLLEEVRERYLGMAEIPKAHREH